MADDKFLLTTNEVFPVTGHVDWHPAYRFGKERTERFMGLVLDELKRMFLNCINDSSVATIGGLWAAEMFSVDVAADDVAAFYPGSDCSRGGQVTYHVICRDFEVQYWITPTAWKGGPDQATNMSMSWDTCWGMEVETVEPNDSGGFNETPVGAKWTNVPWWSPSYMQVAAAIFTMVCDDIRERAGQSARANFMYNFVPQNNVMAVVQSTNEQFYDQDKVRRGIDALHRAGMTDDDIEAMIRALIEDR